MTDSSPKQRLSRPGRGQGIVEYAGAITVAAAVVVGLILAAPPTYNQTFSGVLDHVVTTLSPS